MILADRSNTQRLMARTIKQGNSFFSPFTGWKRGFVSLCLVMLLIPFAEAKKGKTALKTDTTATVIIADTLAVAAGDAIAITVIDTVSALPVYTRSEAFIRLGDLVAERDVWAFRDALLATYKKAGGQVGLDRLCLWCGGSWGAVAYALVLQAVTKESMQTILLTYGLCSNDWECAAVKLGAVYRANQQPGYTFGIYLQQQEASWRKKLDEPIRWRQKFFKP